MCIMVFGISFLFLSYIFFKKHIRYYHPLLHFTLKMDVKKKQDLYEKDDVEELSNEEINRNCQEMSNRNYQEMSRDTVCNYNFSSYNHSLIQTCTIPQKFKTWPHVYTYYIQEDNETTNQYNSDSDSETDDNLSIDDDNLSIDDDNDNIILREAKIMNQERKNLKESESEKSLEELYDFIVLETS